MSIFLTRASRFSSEEVEGTNEPRLTSLDQDEPPPSADSQNDSGDMQLVLDDDDDINWELYEDGAAGGDDKVQSGRGVVARADVPMDTDQSTEGAPADEHGWSDADWDEEEDIFKDTEKTKAGPSDTVNGGPSFEMAINMHLENLRSAHTDALARVQSLMRTKEMLVNQLAAINGAIWARRVEEKARTIAGSSQGDSK